ncbi:MAG: LacI family DNA-binding transcriptional regulator [Nocardioidaceae bacterium]
MTVTRRDVAQRAGTSPAVVSYVLNGGPRGVAPGTRDRVLAAVKELGYRPNRVAAALRSNTTMTLGLVVPDSANPYFAELARAIEEVAFAGGYTLLMGNASDDEERQTTYVRTFLDRRVDGLMLIPAHDAAQCLEELNASGTPWIVLDRRLEFGDGADQVVTANRDGGREVTQHLIEHGYRRIACIAGPGDVKPTGDRVRGWRDGLDRAGIPSETMPLYHVAFGRAAGYRAAMDLFATHRPESIDAVFVTSDEQAVGVLRALVELRLRCPDDVAVASFDGVAASAYTTPALTTMRQPIPELASTALRLLVERMKDPHRTPEIAVLSSELVRRGSCGCPDPLGGEQDLYATPETRS